MERRGHRGEPSVGRALAGREREEVPLKALRRLWCRWFHRRISRPFHGAYVCFECLEWFEVEW